MIQRIRKIILYGLAICAMVRSVKGTEFYVDSKAGDDSRDGGTPVDAWRTVNRANRAEFKPGDRLLLCGGGSFVGPLLLGPEDSGAPDNRMGASPACCSTILATTTMGPASLFTPMPERRTRTAVMWFAGT